MYNKNFIVICISSTIAAFPPMAVVLLGGIITAQIMMKDSLATVPMTLMIKNLFQDLSQLYYY